MKKTQTKPIVRCIVRIVFTTKNKCYKFKVDLDEVRIDEILKCLEEQYDLR